MKGFKNACDGSESEEDERTPTSDNSDDSPKAFYHNPIHDAESLWWVCVEKVLTKQVLLDGETLVDRERFTAQWFVASTIFPSVNGSKRRESFLRTKATFYDCMGALHPKMTAIVALLDRIRRQLVLMYETTEAKAPLITGEGYSQEHLYTLVNLFLRLASAARGMMLADFPENWISEEVAFNGTKRKSNKRKRTDEIVHGPFTRLRTTPSKLSRYVMDCSSCEGTDLFTTDKIPLWMRIYLLHRHGKTMVEGRYALLRALLYGRLFLIVILHTIYTQRHVYTML